MVKNMDSKNENGGIMHDERLRFAQDAARDEMEKYPRLKKWQAELFAKAPIRKTTAGYPHLDGFVKKHEVRGIA